MKHKSRHFEQYPGYFLPCNENEWGLSLSSLQKWLITAIWWQTPLVFVSQHHVFFFVCLSAMFVLEDLCHKWQISTDPILSFFHCMEKSSQDIIKQNEFVCHGRKSHRYEMTCGKINDPRIWIIGYITSSKPFIVHFSWDFGSLKSTTFFQLFVPTKIKPVFVVTHIRAKSQGKTPPQN